MMCQLCIHLDKYLTQMNYIVTQNNQHNNQIMLIIYKKNVCIVFFGCNSIVCAASSCARDDTAHTILSQ